jgi:hypothetical protein
MNHRGRDGLAREQLKGSWLPPSPLFESEKEEEETYLVDLFALECVLEDLEVAEIFVLLTSVELHPGHREVAYKKEGNGDG